MKLKIACMHKRRCSNFYSLTSTVSHWAVFILPQKKSVPLILTALLFSTPALSQTLEGCPVSGDAIIYQAPPVFTAQELEHINISADKTRSDNQGKSTFQGHVVIEKHELRITADNASYNSNTEYIDIEGNIHVDTINMGLNADLGRVSKEKKSALFTGVEFQVGSNNMRGSAESISAEKDDNTELKQTSITTCDPKDPSWRLDADNINLNHEAASVSARDVVLHFIEVPVLYMPYM
mgnify:CR=1 FL=1